VGKIRVAIAGLGSCASALIQGVEYYRHQKAGEIPGLMHVNFGGYYIDDIEFVAAFDVNSLKIGRDISEAIFADPNLCAKFADVPPTGVRVQPGPVADGVAPHMVEPFHIEEDIEPVDVVEALRESGADMLINYLPVGSAEGTELYANAALDAGCAYINCIPEFIASVPEWAKRFEEAGLPVAGDDIKSQVGATILHRAMAELFYDRGVHIDSTYQLNIGGNTDFLNMTVESRLQTKFGNLPIVVDLKLTVNDSPNSGGVVIDVIRAAKLALDRGIGGPLTGISSYAFKHPPVQVNDEVAHGWVEEFIEGKRER